MAPVDVLMVVLIGVSPCKPVFAGQSEDAAERISKSLTGQRGSKDFFFEKKKQKTSIRLAELIRRRPPWNTSFLVLSNAP